MDLCVHLKVCEACGCLWYRAQFETGVYCHPCDKRLQDFPTAQSRKRKGRPRKVILPAVYAVHALADFGGEENFIAGDREPGEVATKRRCNRNGRLDGHLEMPDLEGVPCAFLQQSFEASARYAATTGGAH